MRDSDAFSQRVAAFHRVRLVGTLEVGLTERSAARSLYGEKTGQTVNKTSLKQVCETPVRSQQEGAMADGQNEIVRATPTQLFPNLVGCGLQALEGERVIIVTGVICATGGCFLSGQGSLCLAVDLQAMDIAFD
jgi:hypothetical protein